MDALFWLTAGILALLVGMGSCSHSIICTKEHKLGLDYSVGHSTSRSHSLAICSGIARSEKLS